MKIPYKLFLILFIYLIPQFLIGKTLINDDLKNSLESLYNNNPKLKYHINILKSKDELVPQAFSDFRPEIKGYYKKG